MSMEAMDTGSTSSPSRKRKLPLTNPAKPEETVFISLDETINKLEGILTDAQVSHGSVFIRGSVACGKTTLARYITKKYPKKYVLVNNGNTEAEWKYNIVEAAGLDANALNAYNGGRLLRNALLQLKADNMVVIVDEAHQLFSYQILIDDLFKHSDDKPLFLLFSAAASAERDGITVVTPPEIGKKYMWYPPMPNAIELALSLKGAGIFLSKESVDYFLKMCGGHRQIFMRAMEWVQEQQKDKEEEWEWDVTTSITNLRHSLSMSIVVEGGGWDKGFRAAIKKSRAVHVNQNFSKLVNIPPIFARVVVEGGKKQSELENQERLLTINGFLMPERKGALEEFVEYDWQNDDVLYGVPNATMAEYYYDRYKKQMNLQTELNANMVNPTSCADQLARVLPYMTFTTVVKFPTSTPTGDLKNPLSSGGLPYEDQYSDAMADMFKKLKFNVSRPLNQNVGKVDLFVTQSEGATFAIENIMVTAGRVGSIFL
jgi:hypothetical protein